MWSSMLHTRPTNGQENKITFHLTHISLTMCLWAFFPKFDNLIFFFFTHVHSSSIPVTAICGGSAGKLLEPQLGISVVITEVALMPDQSVVEDYRKYLLSDFQLIDKYFNKAF